MISLARLHRNRLIYHWRTHLAVVLCVAAGSAALSGALLVGDSMHGSLREQALRRLGPVDEALVAPRFFREQLAVDLAEGSREQRTANDNLSPTDGRRSDVTLR